MSVATCLRRLLALTSGSLVLWGLVSCGGNNAEDQGSASRLSRLVLMLRTTDSTLPAGQRASTAPVQSQRAHPGDPTFATRFEVRVQAMDIHSPLQASFLIPPDQPAEIARELFVPIGAARTITVVFFNAVDVAIFEGQTTVDVLRDIVSVTVTLTPLFPRVTSPGNQENREGDEVSLQIAATRRGAAPLTFSATNMPPGLRIDPATGLIAGTLPFSAAGAFVVTVTASDGTLSMSVSFTWTILNVNRAPMITQPENQNNRVGEGVALQIIATDPDADLVTFRAMGLPPGLSIGAATGLISGILPFSAGGTYTVSITASDATLSDSTTFTWLVTNLPPTANAGSDQMVFIEQMVTLDCSASSDPDGGPLTFRWSFVSTPPGSRARLSDPTAIRPTFVVDLRGRYVAQCIVNDGTASSAPDSVTITVDLLLPRFAYVANRNDATVSIYLVDASTGQLRHHGYVAVVTASFLIGPESLAVDGSNRFLFVANADSAVTGFTIAATTGALRDIPGSPFPAPVTAGAGRIAVAVHPSSQFLYVANAAAAVVAFAIDPTTGALALIGTFATGTGPESITVDRTGRFAYVGNVGSNNVSGFTIDHTTGALTPMPGSPFPSGDGPHSVAVDPSGRFVYLVNRGSDNISGYRIDQTTGALSPIAGAPFAAGNSPLEVTVDPAGRFVYVANGGSRDVSGYSIDTTTGALSPIVGSPFPTGASPSAVTERVRVDPSGRFVYVTNAFSNNVSIFAIDATTGALTPSTPVSTRAGPTGIVLSGGPASVTISPRFAYVANRDSNDISPFTINVTTGALTPLTPPVPTGGFSESVVVEPSGRFLYVDRGRGPQNIAGFAIDATTGALTPLAPPVATGRFFFPVVVEPSGRFLYAAAPGLASNDIAGFAIDATTGALTPLAPSVPSASPFSELVVEPSGRFLYGLRGFSNDIAGFAIDATTGVLTPLALPVPAGSDTRSVAVEPSGRFLYVANQGDIAAFTIDAVTGALTPLGAPVPVDTVPISGVFVVVEPSGRFLYVANQGDIAAFTIDAVTGALTPLGAPVPAGSNPRSVVVEPSGRFLYESSEISNDISAFTIDAITGALTPLAPPVPTGIRPVSVAISGTIQ